MQMWSLLDESRYLFTLCHKGQFVMNIKMFKEAFFFFFFCWNGSLLFADSTANGLGWLKKYQESNHWQSHV